MFGRAERFSDSHGALCLLGSFAGPYAIIYSTFTFNRLIRAGIKVGFENVGQGEALRVSEGR